MIAFSQLIGTITEEMIYKTIRASAQIVNIDPEAMRQSSVVRSFLKSIVPYAIYSACGQTIPKIAASGFLDYAPDGPWLEALGEQHFGVERIRATFLTTQALFTNTGVLAGTVPVGKAIVKNGATGKTYTNAAAFSVGAAGEANSVNVPVDIIAREIGSASNAGVGQINAMVSSPIDGLTVTNPNAAFATDLERRVDYIARCKASPNAASPFGPKQAYEYWARSAKRADGSAIGATRVKVVDDDPYSGIFVYLADVDGPISSPDADVIELLLLANVVGHGVPYGNTLPATGVNVPVTFTAEALLSEGLTYAEIMALVNAALADLFSTWPIGGYSGVIYQSKIRSTIQSIRTADGASRIFTDVQVSSPPTNVSLDPDEVAVLGTVSGTIGFI